MRDHDLDLIAALVEGRLEDETEARALIASSQEHAAEYEAQKTAYEALRGVGSVAMTDIERAALHRDVWSALRADTAPKASNPGWYRWTAVAAGLLVVASSVGVLTQSLGGEDAAETFVDLAGDMDSGGGAATTTAAASEEPRGGGDDSAEGDEGGFSATTLAEAAPEDGEGSPTAEPATLYSARASAVREGDYEDPGATEYTEEEDAGSDIATCVADAIAAAGLTGYEVVALLSDLEEEAVEDDPSETTTTVSEETAELAVATPTAEDLSTAPLAFVDLEQCVVVHVDE